MLHFRAELFGHHEVPLVITDATAEFSATLNDDETELTYELTWNDLESAPIKAHIHLGKPGTNGSDIVTLCDADGLDPFDNVIPTMEGLSGSVAGTLRSDHVVDVSTQFAGRSVNQGIARGEFGKFVAALKDGFCHVNIHTQNYSAPIGLLRGQIEKGARNIPAGRKDV